MQNPLVFVTNFNKNFTGVSATAAGVVAVQHEQLDMRLVGVPLPNCPNPITKKQAFSLCRQSSESGPFCIWHVRRNTEMRAAIWARDVLKLPIKIVFTSAAQRRHSAYPRWLISKMDAIVATTPEAAKYIDNVWEVVPHGVNTKRFTPAHDRENAWQKLGYRGKFGVANVGRIRPEKGTDVFVDTMLRVLPNKPDLVALIIGKAKREHQAFELKLRDKVERAGLSDRILFLGEVAADQMPMIMKAISLLIALPRYEGYGMTPLEALSCGTPFVATQTGYFETFSKGGTVGTVVDVEDTDAAVRAVHQWFSDDIDLAQVAKSARDFVIDHHSIEQEVAGIQKVYDAIWRKS